MPRPALKADDSFIYGHNAANFTTAVCDGQVVHQQYGRPTIPTCVRHSHGQLSMAEGVAEDVDSDIISGYCSILQATARRNGVVLEVDGEEFYPEEIAAFTAGSFVRAAQLKYPNCTKVAAAVPAHFNKPQIKAMRDSLIMEGATEVKIIPEPVAVVLHLIRNNLINGEPKFLLVIDGGAGTWDLSAVTIGEADGKQRFTVKGQAANNLLGGLDVDKALRDIAIRKAGRPVSKPKSRSNILIKCENAKIRMSTQSQLEPKFNIECDDGTKVEVTLTRNDFDTASVAFGAYLYGSDPSIEVMDALAKSIGVLTWVPETNTHVINIILMGSSQLEASSFKKFVVPPGNVKSLQFDLYEGESTNRLQSTLIGTFSVPLKDGCKEGTAVCIEIRVTNDNVVHGRARIDGQELGPISFFQRVLGVEGRGGLFGHQPVSMCDVCRFPRAALLPVPARDWDQGVICCVGLCDSSILHASHPGFLNKDYIVVSALGEGEGTVVRRPRPADVGLKDPEFRRCGALSVSGHSDIGGSSIVGESARRLLWGEPERSALFLRVFQANVAEATVEDHLATTSDHFTLSITLPEPQYITGRPGKVRVSSDEEVKRSHHRFASLQWCLVHQNTAQAFNDIDFRHSTEFNDTAALKRDAVQQLFSRRSARRDFRAAAISSTVIIDEVKSSIYTNGVLCYVTRRTIQILHLHRLGNVARSVNTELSASIRQKFDIGELLSAISFIGNTQNYQIKLLYYACGILSFVLFADNQPGRQLMIYDIEKNVSSLKQLSSPGELFVRNDCTHLWYGVCGRGSFWELERLDLRTKRWGMDPFQLPDTFRPLIGRKTCFEIIDGCFYAVSLPGNNEEDDEIDTHYHVLYILVHASGLAEGNGPAPCWRRNPFTGFARQDKALALIKDELSGCLQVFHSYYTKLVGPVCHRISIKPRLLKKSIEDQDSSFVAASHALWMETSVMRNQWHCYNPLCHIWISITKNNAGNNGEMCLLSSRGSPWQDNEAESLVRWIGRNKSSYSTPSVILASVRYASVKYAMDERNLVLHDSAGKLVLVSFDPIRELIAPCNKSTTED
ncbi:Heat shock 70 kDa protein [Paramyrothecium foliicola]|nr:Heat shock 70 kDa protein [Paramyrothecium foliicola]